MARISASLNVTRSALGNEQFGSVGHVVDVVAEVTQAATDFDTMAHNGASFNLTTLLSNQTYNAVTKQLSGVPSGSATLTVPQQQGLIGFINALGADLVLANNTPDLLVSVNVANAPSVSVIQAAFNQILNLFRGNKAFS
jgi:hypothetical protein